MPDRSMLLSTLTSSCSSVASSPASPSVAAAALPRPPAQAATSTPAPPSPPAARRRPPICPLDVLLLNLLHHLRAHEGSDQGSSEAATPCLPFPEGYARSASPTPALLTTPPANTSSHLLGYPDVLDRVAPDVGLRHAPELVRILQEPGAGSIEVDPLSSSTHACGLKPSRVACMHLGARPAFPVARTLDVQMTSLRWMFIQVSQRTMCPLYVSPFLSSISCMHQIEADRRSSLRAHATHALAQRHSSPLLTTGCPCAVFKSESGSMAAGSA
jgi:hypothetical protein